ncbi:hexose transporter [Hysterangium stoloniferum]|nr:hexose transporter [Hysterangium stoloniferum]
MGGGAVALSSGHAPYAHLVDTDAWWKNPRRIKLNLWVLLLLITSYSVGYDGSMMNGLLSLSIFEDQFNHPSGGKLGLFNAIQNIGSLGALPFAPFVTDWFGRRKAILLGAVIMCFGAGVQAGARNLGMFIAARLVIFPTSSVIIQLTLLPFSFCMGFGLAFAANAAPLLISEIAYPTQRAQLTSTYNSLWYSGAIVAAWTTFGTFFIKNSWSWRIPSALQALPSVLQVLLIWFAPESPRWLISKDRDAEAREILAYYHARGNTNDPLVEFEFNEIKEAIRIDREVAANVGYRSLFATPGNRRRMRIIIALAFFSQWSGNGLVSYYLNQVFDTIGITDNTTQLLINGILQIWNLAWALGASALCDKAGRRKLFLSSCAGMLVFFVMQTVCSAQFALTGSKQAAYAVIAFIFLFFASYDIAFSPLPVAYSVEILPYAIRAKGFNILNFTISVAIIFNQYVNPIALKAIGWKYYIVYDCWLAFQLVYCYLFVVETKNHTLEETAMIFDGEDGVKQVFNSGAVVAGKVDTGSHEKISHLDHA